MTALARRRRIDLVAIGCSAGGFEALGQLLPGLPPEMPFPIVVVLHVPPDSTISVADTLAHRCRIRLKEAEDKESLAPGTAYFAPPGYHLLVETDRSFALSVEDPVRFSRPSIDVFLESAAIAYGDRLAAVILTGANEDGADGLRRVVGAGGLGVVQEPASARIPTMPQSAIDAAKPELVLPLDRLAGWLLRQCQGNVAP